MKLHVVATALCAALYFLVLVEGADVIPFLPLSPDVRSLAYAGVRQAFTTRNRNEDGRRVVMELVDGPFSLLQGEWQFHPLNRPGTTGEPQIGRAHV